MAGARRVATAQRTAYGVQHAAPTRTATPASSAHTPRGKAHPPRAHYPRPNSPPRSPIKSRLGRALTDKIPKEAIAPDAVEPAGPEAAAGMGRGGGCVCGGGGRGEVEGEGEDGEEGEAGVHVWSSTSEREYGEKIGIRRSKGRRRECRENQR